MLCPVPIQLVPRYGEEVISVVKVFDVSMAITCDGESGRFAFAPCALSSQKMISKDMRLCHILYLHSDVLAHENKLASCRPYLLAFICRYGDSDV